MFLSFCFSYLLVEDKIWKQKLAEIAHAEVENLDFSKGILQNFLRNYFFKKLNLLWRKKNLLVCMCVCTPRFFESIIFLNWI